MNPFNKVAAVMLSVMVVGCAVSCLLYTSDAADE